MRCVKGFLHLNQTKCGGHHLGRSRSQWQSKDQITVSAARTAGGDLRPTWINRFRPSKHLALASMNSGCTTLNKLASANKETIPRELSLPASRLGLSDRI